MIKNNKGQVLVLFVLMVPLIIFIIAYFLENMFISNEKQKLDNINQMLIEYSYENKENVGLYDAILNLALKNDKEIIIESFDINIDYIEITLSKNMDSMFGKIIGINKYEIISKYKAIISDDKVIYEKK